MSRIDYSHTTHLTDTFLYAYNIPDGLLLRSMRSMKKIIWIIEIGHFWYIRKCVILLIDPSIIQIRMLATIVVGFTVDYTTKLPSIHRSV